MIRRRGVYHIAGYYPFGGALWYRYFKREAAAFARLWNVGCEVSDVARPGPDSSPSWTITTKAKNWQVETRYQPLLWDDIVLADAAEPASRRYRRAFRAIADFLLSGTLFRYFRASWQYAFFVLYPFLLLLIFAAIAWAAAGLIAGYFGLSNGTRITAELVAAIALFLALVQWPGHRWRLQHALDDWAFSWDYLHLRRPDMDRRLDDFADEIVAQARRNAVDEIILVGHSMGAALAVDLLARALARDPNLGRHGPTLCLVTVGSTIPKFTLHPAGDYIRRRAERIIKDPSIVWAEYHARADAISFYKFNAVTLSRFYGDRIDGKPIFRRVRISHMLSRKTYLRNRFNFMRLHCQYIMANERRAPYDYFMMICGPIPFMRYAVNAKGPADLIALDGALIDPAMPAPIVTRATADAQVQPG
jgi:pimeloyl-ACP methyl ester carboxylesterase